MNLLTILDEKADELLDKVGVKNKDVQNLIEVGGVTLIGYMVYRLWRKTKKEKKHGDGEKQ